MCPTEILIQIKRETAITSERHDVHTWQCVSVRTKVSNKLNVNKIKSPLHRHNKHVSGQPLS